MFPHTSGSKISQRHQFHQLEPRGVRSFDVKGKQIKGEKKAIKLLETFEYKPEKYAERVNHICFLSSEFSSFKKLFISVAIFFTSL